MQVTKTDVGEISQGLDRFEAKRKPGNRAVEQKETW